MSWSTELFCNLSFNRETYNSKYEVKSKIDELNRYIDTCEKSLRDLALMTEPSKYIDNKEESNPYFFVTSTFEDNMELLEEYYIERYKLSVLLENWENCHNKDGLAIDPPDGVTWNSAYLYGDFVKSVKHPDDKSLLG